MNTHLGIASTTHIDRHNDKMTLGALEGAAEQANSRLIPYLINHDFNQQIGVILYGEVFQLDDGEYALGVVVGLYESEYDKDTFKKGLPNTFTSAYEKYFDKEFLLDLSRSNDSSNIKTERPNSFSLPDMLERFLNSTAFTPEGEIYYTKQLVASVGDLKIEVYPKDHFPPHFHVVSRSRGLNARFDLQTMEVISVKTGDLRGRDTKKIQKFFEMHPEMLEKLQQVHSKLCD
jgi:hypothetical protein